MGESGDYHSENSEERQLDRCCYRLWGRRKREHGDGFDDVEAGTAEELVDGGLVQAGGVVFDADGLLRLVEGEAADTVDFADLRQGQGGCLRGGDSVAVQDVKLGHVSIISAGVGRGVRRDFRRIVG